MKNEDMKIIENGRKMLKPDWDTWNFEETDQKKELPEPDPYALPEYAVEAAELVLPDENSYRKFSLYECVKKRSSKRKYTEDQLTADELSYLLWVSHGVRETRNGRIFRTAPSGGNRHCINTFVYIGNVEGLKKGVYRYLPMENKIALFNGSPDAGERLGEAANYFNAQLVFIWTAVPYRMEYRYSTVAHKMVAIEAGHICQNLCLAAEAIGGGAVPIAAYSQKKADALLSLDGEEEFVIYLAAAGK